MTDRIEFHHRDKIIAWSGSSHAPDRGDLVNIRKETWKVLGRSFTLDYADNARERSLVCVINLCAPTGAGQQASFEAAQDALLGQRWTPREADFLINLIEIGRAA